LVRHLKRKFGNAPAVVDGLLDVIADQGSLDCNEVSHGPALSQAGQAIEISLQPPLTKLKALAGYILNAARQT